MEKMKEECFKTIKEVIKEIEMDEGIVGLVERIKSHEWVKVVGG